MSIDPATYKAPPEPKRTVLKPNHYTVRLVDIEQTITASTFKDPKTGEQKPDVHQLKLTLCLVDDPEKQFLTWVKDGLFVGNNTKNKNTTLPALLLAITGQEFKPEDRAKITPDFLNSLMQAEFRVATSIGKSTKGSEFTQVDGFFPKD